MPKIFISYRRTDSAYAAHQIRDVLSDQFGAENIVFDVETIPLGMDFRDYINDQIMQCDVLLALMGDDWGKIIQERRDDPKDFVRIEIETALKRDIPVIPVLVERAIMPDESDLPDSIAPLAYRNATEVRAGADFRAQLTRLVSALDHLLSKFQQAGTEAETLKDEKHERVRSEQHQLEQERQEEKQATHESAEQRVQEQRKDNKQLPGQVKPGKEKNIFGLIGIVGVILLAVSSYLIYSFFGSKPNKTQNIALSKETIVQGKRLLLNLDKTKNNSPNSKTVFDPFPNGGIRSTYYHLATYLTYQSIGRISPFPVFSSGPHTRNMLNLHEKYTFGHYNPYFLRWAGLQLKHITGEKAFIKETRGLVKAYLYPTLIKYYRAHAVLQANPDDWKKLLLDYQTRIKARNLPRHYYWDYLFDKNNLQKYPGLAKYLTESKTSPGILGMTVNFWLRRDIDGTEKDIFSILDSFLKAYQLIDAKGDGRNKI